MANFVNKPEFEKLKILELLKNEDDLSKVMDEFERLHKSRGHDDSYPHFLEYEIRKEKIDQINQSRLNEYSKAQEYFKTVDLPNGDEIQHINVYNTPGLTFTSAFQPTSQTEFQKNLCDSLQKSSNELRTEFKKLDRMRNFEIEIMQTSIKVDFVKKIIATVKQHQESMCNGK